MAERTPVTQLVAIGASAGGIEALSALVATLPADFPAPIVVAQHLDPTPAQPPAGDPGAAAAPCRCAPWSTTRALEAGVIYVVPANRHVSITDHHLSVDPDGAGRPKPSIDLLFRSRRRRSSARG